MADKYIVKAYDYDGSFYGYFAEHPDDKENKYYSYYVDERKDARHFDSYAEADKVIERFADGSDLEFAIIKDFSGESMSLAEHIENWVEQNYGPNEADDPSWNIEALANSIQEFMNK